MKTYTYSYQNGLCRGASTDAGEFGRVPGKLGRRPEASESVKQVVSRFPTPRKAQNTPLKVSEASGRLRTAPAGAWKLAGYPKGPECTYHGRGVLHTPPQPGRKARMGRTRPGCRPAGP